MMQLAQMQKRAHAPALPHPVQRLLTKLARGYVFCHNCQRIRKLEVKFCCYSEARATPV